jgi:hypothetical protein
MIVADAVGQIALPDVDGYPLIFRIELRENVIAVLIYVERDRKFIDVVDVVSAAGAGPSAGGIV